MNVNRASARVSVGDLMARNMAAYAVLLYSYDVIFIIMEISHQQFQRKPFESE